MSSTKPIAARIPMDEYIKLQAEALDAKMSMSDYVIYLVYKARKGGIEPVQNVTLENMKKKLLELSKTYDTYTEDINAFRTATPAEDVLLNLCNGIKKLVEDS